MRRMNFQTILMLSQSPISYWVGMVYYKKGQWTKAIFQFEETLNKSPRHAYGHFKLGMCYFRQKNWLEAKEYIDYAIILSDGNNTWKEQSRQCTKLLNNKGFSHDISEKKIKSLLNKNDKDAQLYYDLSLVKRKNGVFWQEVDALKTAIGLKDTNPDWHFHLGEALESMNRYEEAKTSYLKAIEIKVKGIPANWFYRLGYVTEYIEKNEKIIGISKAEEHYKKAIVCDDKLNSKELGIGTFHQNRGYWKEAISAYQKQLELKPLSAELHYKLGMSFDRCYQWIEAEKHYKSALSINISNEYWHYRLGFVLERQDKFERAADAYNYASAISRSHNVYFFYRWGYVLAKLADYSQACEVFIEGYKESYKLQEPKGAIPSRISDNSSMKIRREVLEKYEQTFHSDYAIASYISVLEQDVSNAEVWFALANVYEKNNKWEKAKEAYEQALSRQNIHMPLWYFRLGFVLYQLGNFKQATDAFINMRVFSLPYGIPESFFDKSSSMKQVAEYTEYYDRLSIAPNIVLYESYHGASVSCNPFSIFNYLIQDIKFSEWKHIWVINDVTKVPEELKNNKNIIFVRRDSDLYLRYLSTAEYLINNNTFPPYFIRKEGQKYLNTWHGTPIKTLGKDIKSSLFEHKNAARNLLHATHVISPNKHTTKALLERQDIEDVISASVVETGYPRNDILRLSDENKRRMRDKLNIPQDKKIIFYAPTYRGSSLKNKNGSGSDKELISFLNKLNSFENVCVLFRGHHMQENYLVSGSIDTIIVPGNIDTNSILSITDLLVTDYSSLAIDFLITNNPIVFYVYDYDEYQLSRGLYFDLNTHFEYLAYDYIEAVNLIKKILGAQGLLNPGYGLKTVKEFCIRDDGNATKRVVDFFLHGICEENRVVPTAVNKRNLLIYPGALIPNGITTSLRNLLKNFDYLDDSITLVLDPQSVSNYPERIEQLECLHEEVNIITRVGRLCFNLEELWVNQRVLRTNGFDSIEMERVSSTAYKREFLRCFGYGRYDIVVNFEGYVRFWTMLFAQKTLSVNKNVIYLHNDMYGEWKERFPNQETIFNYYKFYNRLNSVSNQTNKINKENLSEKYTLSESKFTYCDNFLDPEMVWKLSNEVIPHNDAHYFEDNGKVFINMARLSVEKGHIQLINAFEEVVRIHKNAKLLILGAGPLENDLIKHIQKAGLENNIFLLGRKFNPFPYLKAADCFVFSSKYEGQGLVLLEAMLLGKPVISTSFPCVYDVLDNGKLGLIVENSKEGLIGGMLSYLDDEKIAINEFNLSKYQADAKESFSRNILN